MGCHLGKEVGGALVTGELLGWDACLTGVGKTPFEGSSSMPGTDCSHSPPAQRSLECSGEDPQKA